MSFKKEVIGCFKDLLPILANPGHEREIYELVKSKFVELGFVNLAIPLIQREYQVNRNIGGDDTIYLRDTPNLGLSYDCGAPVTIVFNAHLDHYFASGITSEYIEKNGQIVSDGKHILGADCKMGISVIYGLVKRALDESVWCNFDIIFDTCEEAGLIGMLEFVNNGLYKTMPFYDKYKKGNIVRCYSFDGLWSEAWEDNLGCYITRNSAIALSNWNMVNKSERYCAVEGSKVFWKKFGKRERQFFDTLKFVMSDEPTLSLIKVMTYGASFVLLNKILPAIMLPVGFYECHTNKEYYCLHHLEKIKKILTSFSNSV